MSEIVFETERLVLRKFDPVQDAAYWMELVNSPKWLKYIGDRNVHTLEEAAAYISNRILKQHEDYGYGAYVMVIKSTGESIGNCGLFKRPVLDHPDIGYALLPQHEGKGYAFEAASMIMQQARDLKLQKVYAITVAYNERSKHLMEKLGLKFEKNFRMEGDPEELCLYCRDLANE